MIFRTHTTNDSTSIDGCVRNAGASSPGMFPISPWWIAMRRDPDWWSNRTVADWIVSGSCPQPYVDILSPVSVFGHWDLGEVIKVKWSQEWNSNLVTLVCFLAPTVTVSPSPSFPASSLLDMHRANIMQGYHGYKPSACNQKWSPCKN